MNNNNMNENLKPKQEIVQNENIIENQQVEEIKNENEQLFKKITDANMREEMKKVDRYYKLFMDCLLEVVKYDIRSDEKLSDKKYIKTNMIHYKDDEKVTVYADIEIPKSEAIYATFFKIYNDLKKKRAEFRFLLDYVKDLKYLKIVVLKEQENLKFLFSYLENIFSYFCQKNVDGNLPSFLENLNPNSEYLIGYDPNCSFEFSTVKFKYDIYDLIKDFYDVEIKNIKECVGESEYKKKVEYKTSDAFKLIIEKELVKNIKNLVKKNNSYFSFIAKLNFDAIYVGLLNLKEEEDSFERGVVKFFNLRRMFKKYINYFRDKINELANVEKKRDVAAELLEKEGKLLRKIYDFIMSCVPELKDVYGEKYAEYIKGNYNKEETEFNNAIKNSFTKQFLEQIKAFGNKNTLSFKISNRMHKGDDYIPTLKKSSYKYRCVNYEDDEDYDILEYFYGFDFLVTDVNYKDIFEKIEGLVDMYGNLKEEEKEEKEEKEDLNSDIKNNILKKINEYLNEIIKFYSDSATKFYK